MPSNLNEVSQQSVNYQHIATAIDYLHQHHKDQPDLEAIAENVHLSPFHFQRLFTEWAGVNPKKFLQFISLSDTKSMLWEPQQTLFDVVDETRLSRSGRLHDLFISIEGMTPGEYKNGGENLEIEYSFSDSPFGRLLIASTPKGICHVTFEEEDSNSVPCLKSLFPNANFRATQNILHLQVSAVFKCEWKAIHPLKLHLKGTDFQLKVWEALLKIPMGQLKSYGRIAKEIEQPNASRAVGTAIGCNPIAYLIPCHRVIQSGGFIGGYRWGTIRKTAIIGWEASWNSNCNPSKNR
ncbi:MAG: cysteine methyltransferase [Flavobacteriales bacterium CG_4_9_14_3_um_filter_40_17]|nr:MAG: cysteine methyltransferase [Flavobacteriales bacterium CG_4_9_14_3_um_filter_40_17]